MSKIGSLAAKRAWHSFPLAIVVGLFAGAGAVMLLAAHAATSSVTPALAGIQADCSVDVTSAINAALQAQPDGSAITFPMGGCYRIDQTIQLTDRNNLTIDGNGSTFEQVTVPAAYAGIPQWRLTGGSNITLANMTVQGVNTTPSYNDKHEWDHNIDILGTQTAVVDSVHGKDAGGDFVEIAPDRRKMTNSDGTGAVIPKDITIKNSDATVTGRNAISCTGCDTVSVTNNKFSEIGYQGIDVEIEASKWYGRNISVTNNTWGSVQLSDFSASGAGLDTTDLTFANNTATASVKTCQPSVYLDSGTPHSTVTITGNTLLAIGTGISVSRATGVTIQDNTATITNGGCGVYRAMYASNVTNGTVSGNDFSSSDSTIALANIAQPITNVIVCGNRMPGSSLFDKPTVCSSGSTSPPPPAPVPAPNPPTGTAPSSSTTSTPAPSSVTVQAPDGKTVVVAQTGSGITQGQLVTLDPTNVTNSQKAQLITRVVYYDNKKLVQTVTKPPYALNTKLLAPGEHQITERTYYKDGTTSERTQAITIRLAAAAKVQSHSKISLLIGLALAILAAIAAGVLVFRRLRRQYVAPAVQPEASTSPLGMYPTIITPDQTVQDRHDDQQPPSQLPR